RARNRSGREDRRAGDQERAQREPRAEPSGGEGGHPGGEPEGESKLPGGGGRDVEVGRDRRQHRRERDQPGLGREEAQKEDGGSAPGIAAAASPPARAAGPRRRRTVSL